MILFNPNNHYSFIIKGDDNGTNGESAHIFLSAIDASTRGVAIGAELRSTSNNHDLVFKTSNISATPTEKLRITNTGDVGIGVTNPTSFGPTLQVSGTDPALLLQDTATAVDYFGVNVTSGITQLWYDDAAAFTINTATGISGSGLAERFRIASNGNTTFTAESFPYCISTSANKKLVIEEFTSYNANGGLRIRKKFPNGNVLSANYWLGDIHFKGWDGDQFIRGAKIEAVVEGTPANNVMPCGLRFSTNPGDASTPERLRITKDGKVGINDTSPDATLSVGGSTALIDVGAAGGNRGKIGYSSNDLYFGTSSSSGEFIFKNNVTSTDNPASSGTERFRISDGGNVTASTENSVMGVDSLMASEW